MIRRSILLLAMTLLCAGGLTALAGTDAPATKVTLQVELTDGSRLTGDTVTKSWYITTAYAKMQIPLSAIKTVTASDDHETFRLVMENDDSFRGVIEAESVDIDTLLGQLKIPLAKVATITRKIDPATE